MATLDNKRIGEIFIKIGQYLKNNPQFINQLEELLKLQEAPVQEMSIDFEKINKLDLFQAIREKTEIEVEQSLSDFNIKELREILKKYRFGSPSKLKTIPQIKEHIIHQLRQRKTDVFHIPNDH